MTNTDIVIPRADLPDIIVELNTVIYPRGSDERWRIRGEVAEIVRKRAVEYLAIADYIERALAEKAKAAEDAKLDDEGLSLYNALHGLKGETWGRSDDYAKKHWRNVARAARELHGK